MDPKAYFKLCAGHDWFYNYSDDGSVYRRGSESLSRLRTLKIGNEINESIFKAWSDYCFNSSPKPKLEDFNLGD